MKKLLSMSLIALVMAMVAPIASAMHLPQLPQPPVASAHLPVPLPPVAHVPNLPFPPVASAHVPPLPTPTCGGPLPPCPGGQINTPLTDLASIGPRPTCDPCKPCPGQPPASALCSNAAPQAANHLPGGPLPLPPTTLMAHVDHGPIGDTCTSRQLPNGCREITCGGTKFITCG